MGFDEIWQEEQKIIQDEETGCSTFYSIKSHQKQTGQEIGNDLDEQKDIIDDLGNLLSNTDTTLHTKTRGVNMVDRKSL